MTNTTNYNFNIVEGTDIVNPLTQLNPNFTDIDTLMKRAANASVNPATCTKTGTVFAIVRNSNLGPASANNVIKFIAPADWNEGDTITIDGTAVTVTLPGGDALPASCFVSGDNVLIIKGTGNTATLYGKPASYIPTASEVAMSSGDSVQDAIDKIGSVIKIVEGGSYAAGDTWVIPSAAQDLIDSGKYYLVEASFYYGDTVSSARLTKVTTRGFGRHVALTLNRTDIQTGLVNISASSFAAYGFDIAHAPKLYDLYLFPIAAY